MPFAFLSRSAAILILLAATIAPAGAAPPDADAPLWVAVDTLRDRATVTPEPAWRATLRDDAALRADRARDLALYVVLEVGPGGDGQLTVALASPVGQEPVTFAPGTYHVVATRVARRP